MASNPIELLISLAVNNARTKENIDENLKALKKYYDRNPLLLNIDFDKTKALNNLQSFIKEASKGSIELNVGLKGADLNSVKSQTQKLKDEFKQLSDIAGKAQGGSAKSFDLDLDRVLIQLDNLGRKGAVASSQIETFRARIDGLRGTTDRLALKQVVTDIFDISSAAGHSDKVLNTLNQALIKVGQAQQKLTDIKDKFTIDPNVNSEYIRIDSTVQKLTSDILKLQSQASTGGADEIKLAQQIRDVEHRLQEATREMKTFANATKQETALAKIENDAKLLVAQLSRIGQISATELKAFQRDILMIAQSGDTTTNKINQMTRAIEAMKERAKDVKFDMNLARQIDSAVLASEKLEAKIIRIGTIHKSTVDKMDYQKLLAQTQQLTANLNRVNSAQELRDLTKEYKNLGAQVDKLGANAVTAARASEGLGQSLVTALKKFPVWMFSATLFYAPIQGIQDLTEKVIELDTALVNLKRVMDAPSYQFDNIIRDMIENVDTLAGKTADYMSLVADFARTGLDANQSQEYANVATILQNISELTPDETVNSLTSAMTSFGESTGGILRIADRLNEIDNNFAITTRDLALSLNKAASTAKTFNVDLDELLGYVTAIGVATRESGNIIGNSLKTIFSRMTTNGDAIKALREIGISVTESSGEMKSASAIISEIAGKWNDLSDAERQNTAVKVAGTNQLSRFNALMLNYDAAIRATDTSIHSQNSAMREQETYSESLQARINQLQNAWYGFADAVGSSVLYDGIVVLTAFFKTVTEGSDGLVSNIGALAPLFGTLAAVIGMASKTVRNFVIDLATEAKAALTSATATNTLGNASAATATKVSALRTAMIGLAASLGIGLAFAAVGFALEKMINVISKGIQEEEEFERSLKASTDALSINKQYAEDLIFEYERLSAVKNAGGMWDAEKEEQYLQVQNDLAEVFPMLVDHIDASGQAYLKNADAIDKVIASTRELANQQNKVITENAAQELEKMSEEINGSWISSLTNFVYGSLESRIKSQKQVLEAMKANDADGGAIAKQELVIMQLEQQVANSADKIKGKVYEIAQAYNSLNNIEIDPNVVKTVESFVDTLDFSNLDPNKLAVLAKEISEIQQEMQRASQGGDASVYEEAVERLNKVASQAKKTDKEFASFTVTYDTFKDSLKKGKPVMVDTEAGLEGMNDAVSSAAEAMQSFKTVQEQLAGVSEAQINSVKDMLTQYEMLTFQLGGYTEQQLRDLQAKENLTSEEQLVVDVLNKRLAVMGMLSDIYPELLTNDANAIVLSEEKRKAIELENQAQKMLIEAYKLSSEGKLTEEQKATTASAQNTIDRIGHIRTEIAALSVLQKKMQDVYNKAKEAYDSGKDPDGRGLARAGTLLGQSSWEIYDYEQELAGLQDTLKGSVGAMSNFVDVSGKGTKTTKEGTKATKESVYITDEYTKAMDRLSVAIEKQRALQEGLREGHNNRRLALAEEIKLQKQQLQLMKDQEASIKKQIASGKIKQTGNVSTENTQTVKGGQKIGGAFDYKISSTYGSRADNHRGVDFAAPKGTAINSPAAGKVIAAGDAKSQGWHWSYGNLVVVQDVTGVKHIMAHMDKVMAKVGDQIVEGIQVGTVGSTGNSTGNHLHYEQNSGNGMVLNPNATVDAIRNGSLTTKGGTYVASSGQESIDQAHANVASLEKDIIAQEKLIRELEAKMVNEVLANFENRKIPLDNTIENVQNNLKKLTESSQAYRNELDKQGKALLDKRKVNQEELVYLQNVIAKGKLSDDALAGLEARLQQLKNENAEIDFAINDNYLAKISSLNALLDETISKYDKLREASDRSIEAQTTALRELDSTSVGYLRALDNINKSMRDKQAANRKELQDTMSLIKQGMYYGEALERATLRVEELQHQIKQLQLDIQDGDFEILIAIKNQGDESVKDIQFEMNRLEEIRKMYEQGSGDYLKYTNDLIEQQKKMADAHLATRDALKEELKQRDITKDRIREIKRLLEDEHIAYLQATNAIADYTKQLEEANNANKQDIANKIIAALKAAYQEMRDEHMKSLDEIAKKEAKAHEDRLKQLKDEQDLFRKNVEERLQLIDRQEAERTYDMEIDELEKERSKIQERMYTISNDDSYAAKKERKQLQEQLDKIDKDIAERRHDRDIELQKQGLQDLLDMKNEEIEGKVEAENEYYENTVEKLNKEKAYWEKHYQDLLNDERKFAQIREDIMNGHFDKVEKELQEHIDNLTATMPQLADTMDGTMRAVGMTIRQNVIDQLNDAIKAMREFISMQAELNSFVDDFGSSIGDIGKDTGTDNPSTSKGNLSQADMKVLLGKFLYDNVAPSLSGAAQQAARETGRNLGQAGYKGGATIDEGLNFGSATSGLTSAEMEAFKQFLQQNLGMNGGAYDKYIKEFLGGNSNIVNTTNRYGVQTPMSYGDMQVMMAKYMREYLISANTPQALKDEIKSQADQMANSGRASGSKVSSDVTYGAVLNSLDKAQRNQFKSFLSNQSGIIRNQDLQNKIRNYAMSLKSGGMLNNNATTGGVDGIGGEWFIGHKGEVVNNPIETAQLLDTVETSRVMLQHLKGLVAPITGLVDKIINNTGGSITEEYIMNFHGDFINVNKTFMERMAGSAFEEIRARKGTFNRNN